MDENEHPKGALLFMLVYLDTVNDSRPFRAAKEATSWMRWPASLTRRPT